MSDALAAANARCLALEETIDRMLPVINKASLLADVIERTNQNDSIGDEVQLELELELIETIAAYRKSKP